MSAISVESRAHRALRDISRFQFAGKEHSAVDQYKTWLNSVSLPGDLIGVYENPQNIEPKAVFVTNRGLLMIGNRPAQCVEFSELESVHGPQNKDDDFDIVLTLRSGTKIHLTIAGTEGRFRDIFSFVRFLNRVLEDRK